MNNLRKAYFVSLTPNYFKFVKYVISNLHINPLLQNQDLIVGIVKDEINKNENQRINKNIKEVKDWINVYDINVNVSFIIIDDPLKQASYFTNFLEFLPFLMDRWDILCFIDIGDIVIEKPLTSFPDMLFNKGTLIYASPGSHHPCVQQFFIDIREKEQVADLINRRKLNPTLSDERLFALNGRDDYSLDDIFFVGKHYSSLIHSIKIFTIIDAFLLFSNNNLNREIYEICKFVLSSFNQQTLNDDLTDELSILFTQMFPMLQFFNKTQQEFNSNNIPPQENISIKKEQVNNWTIIQSSYDFYIKFLMIYKLYKSRGLNIVMEPNYGFTKDDKTIFCLESQVDSSITFEQFLSYLKESNYDENEFFILLKLLNIDISSLRYCQMGKKIKIIFTDLSLVKMRKEISTENNTYKYTLLTPKDFALISNEI